MNNIDYRWLGETITSAIDILACLSLTGPPIFEVRVVLATMRKC